MKKPYIIDRREFSTDSDWNVSNALHMMKLSYAVYAGTTDNIGTEEDWSIVEKLLAAEEARYAHERIEDRNGIYEPNAMICWDIEDDVVFLIFRGTEPTSLNQWLIDANFIKEDIDTAQPESGKSHRGFLNNVNQIFPSIKEILDRECIGKSRSLFVAGHSLGAGMSQVVCSKLIHLGEAYKPTAIYNFGCPRALDEQAAAAYNEKLGDITYRVVNNNDLVCDVPFEKMGFSHVGQMKYISSDLQEIEDISLLGKAIDKFKGGIDSLKNLDPVDFVTDHLPDRYTESLTQLKNSS